MIVRIAPAIMGTVEFSVSQEVIICENAFLKLGERGHVSRCLDQTIKE